MLRRVQQFLNDFVAKLVGVNATAARKELDSLVQEMAVNEADQASSTLSAKSQTATQEALRKDLKTHHMHPVAAIAAAHLKDVPGFKALEMPNKDEKVAELVQHAIAMADAANQHQQVFVDNGLPADFADQLVAAANAVRASVDARAQAIGTRASARDGLKANASRAHAVVRVLNAQVKSVLEDDPKALAGWKSAKRIGKGKVVPIEATVSPVPQVPAPTTQAVTTR